MPTRGYGEVKKAETCAEHEALAYDEVIMPNKEQVDKWKKFANCIKEKRLKKPSSNIGGKWNKDAKAEPMGLSYIINKKEIAVQPLATEATAKAQKYEQSGAQEFVDFPYEEVLYLT